MLIVSRGNSLANIFTFGFQPQGTSGSPTGTDFRHEFHFLSGLPNHVVRFGFPPVGTSGETTTVSGADGPPWHLTEKERKRLEEYARRLQGLPPLPTHFEAVQEILDEVEEPTPTTVELVEQRILALTPLNKRSLFAANLKALKAEVERARFEREDEEEVEMLLSMFL